MGTLSITYNGTTKNYTVSGAPVVAYNSKTLLTASGWSGTKTLKCAGKFMKTNVTAGSNTLKCAGKLAKTDIVLKYTVNSTASYQTIKTSGTFTIPSGYNRVQFFLVGGGAGARGAYARYSYNDDDGGDSDENNSGGGGGGYTTTTPTITTSSGTSYTVTIGSGSTHTWTKASHDNTPIQAGSSSVKIGNATYSAEGGWSLTTNSPVSWGFGGAGGSGGGGGNGDSGMFGYAAGGAGGTNGGNGTSGYYLTSASKKGYSRGTTGGTGQGTSTTFNGITYAGGGGGGTVYKTSYTPKTSCGLGSNGGGNGNLYIWAARPNGTHKRAATGGTANTGGGGGSINITAYDYEASFYLQAPSGGSGVVIAKLWEA